MLKGQLVFQFIVAATVFFSIVLFIITYLNNIVSSFSNDFFMDVLQSKAVEVSEILVHDPGMWGANGPEIVGLADSWPVLNSTKIGMLVSYCHGNYTGLLQKLGLEEKLTEYAQERILNVNIKIVQANTRLLDCGPDPPSVRTGNMERFAVSGNGGLLRIDVAVW